MSRTVGEIVQMPDPAVILDEIDQYSATALIRHLRSNYELDPRKRVSYRIAEVLHQRNPDNIVATTVFAAVLKDVGELERAGRLLANRLREDCNWHFLRVVGSVLWKRRLRTSARFAFELAQEFEDAGKGNYQITGETLQTLRARLLGTWLPDDRFFQLAGEGMSTELTSEELANLEVPVQVQGLDGYSIRPLKSKRQLARVANQLQNCLNSYLGQVVNGTTLLFAVEHQGTPVEAIEVNPASRKIVQWKGVRNSNPDPRLKSHIQETLVNLATSGSIRPSTSHSNH